MYLILTTLKHVPNTRHLSKRFAELGWKRAPQYYLPIKFHGLFRSGIVNCKTSSLHKKPPNKPTICINPKGTRGSSGTSSTKGSCPARCASTGSAHVVAGSSVLALTAVLAAWAKASLGASCSGGIKTR